MPAVARAAVLGLALQAPVLAVALAVARAAVLAHVLPAPVLALAAATKKTLVCLLVVCSAPAGRQRQGHLLLALLALFAPALLAMLMRGEGGGGKPQARFSIFLTPGLVAGW